MRGTPGRMWDGNMGDRSFLCPCAPDMPGPSRHWFSSHTSRGSNDLQNSQPVNRYSCQKCTTHNGYPASAEEGVVRTSWKLWHYVVAILSLIGGLAMPVTPLWALTVVNLNLMHGMTCARPGSGDGQQCRVRDRIALLFQHLGAAGCPDLVTLEENVTRAFVPQRTATGAFGIVGPLDDTVVHIEAGLSTLAAVCGLPYGVVF